MAVPYYAFKTNAIILAITIHIILIMVSNLVSTMAYRLSKSEYSTDLTPLFMKQHEFHHPNLQLLQ